jgi:hypothetical protein
MPENMFSSNSFQREHWIHLLNRSYHIPEKTCRNSRLFWNPMDAPWRSDNMVIIYGYSIEHEEKMLTGTDHEF